jgi:uncharacterized protein YkwD/PKD repeat protein
MRPRASVLLTFIFFIIGSVILASWSYAAANSQQTAVYPGIVFIDGAVQLNVTIDPPIGKPGDTLNMRVSARNQDISTYTPSITIKLPSQLNLTNNILPAGATRNFQTNELTWRPVLAANGGSQQFVLPLRVETIDITSPDQMVTAVIDLNGSVKEADTAIWLGLPPQIDDVIMPSQVAVGLPVQLRAATSGPGPISQSWLLGDGRRVDVNDPVVVFPAVGVYELSLEAKNMVGGTTASRQLTVVPHPAAQFKMDDDTPGMGQIVTFINESGGQKPLAYHWDFGDGTTSTDLNPTHQYQTSGAYNVRLVVENEYGRSEAVWPLSVGQLPQADMQITEYVSTGQPLIGQAFGDETVTQYLWDMGDGKTEMGEQISHSYTRQGDYYVSLTAVNDFGSSQVGRWIYAEGGAQEVYLPLVLKSPESQTAGAVEGDPFAIVLDPVELDEPFVLQPMELPAGTSQAEALLIYINEARRQFNLSPVKYVYELSVAAQNHTADMAAYQFTSHTGSDGSYPAERLLWHRYQGAYAGEATAWGFEHAYQAVEFWINSPAHRRIVLNQWATDVGVAFTTDYNAPNVWYWTAEFGNAFGQTASPLLRVQSPASESEVLNTDWVTYSWNWPMPLEPGQQFGVYVADEAGRETKVGTLDAPTHGTLYRFQGALIDVTETTGLLDWVVRLRDGNVSLVESESRGLSVLWNPDLPTPTPELEPTAVVTGTPPATVTPTATSPRTYPTITPRPTEPPPPLLVTATPIPSSP